MPQLLCNAFNDPNDPWYYVLGIVFLVLIFGALAGYIILSGKLKKNTPPEGDNKQDESHSIAQPEEEIVDEAVSDDNTKAEPTDNAMQKQNNKATE